MDLSNCCIFKPSPTRATSFLGTGIDECALSWVPQQKDILHVSLDFKRGFLLGKKRLLRACGVKIYLERV